MRSRTPELRTPLSWGGPCWWFGHEWQQRYPRHVRRLAVLNARTLLAVYGLLNARRAPHCGRLIQGEAPRCLGNNRWSIRRSPKPDEDPSVPSAWFLNSRVECVPASPSVPVLFFRMFHYLAKHMTRRLTCLCGQTYQPIHPVKVYLPKS